jgi:hypothetical protein
MEKCFDLDLKVSRKMVLMVLCFHYPNIFPSEARIAKEAGIGLTAAKAAIKHLERDGWIKRRPRHSKSTVYTVDVARIMATPPRKLGIPAVEGGLPFPGPEAEGTSQPPESAGIRPSKQAQTAGIRPINSRNPATNRQDNKQVLTDNRNKPEKASRQKHTRSEIDIESRASKELENKPQGLNAGMEIESTDLASSGNLPVDAQSALRPNCASSKPEVGGVEDHGNRADLLIPADYTYACQQELDTTTSPLPAGLPQASNTSTSSKDGLEGIIADDAEEDAEDNAEPVVAVPQQAMPATGPAERATSAPKPQPKPACKYGISQGPVCWFIEDKDRKTVARAPTMEQAYVTALDMSETPHARFLAFKSDGVCRVFDTQGGVAKVVKTCATIEEAREEATRLTKESQQPRSLKPAA